MTTATTQNSYLDGQAYMDCSQDTAAQVDDEVRKMLDKAFGDALNILKTHRELLDEIAEYLLLKETITGEELMAYVNAAQAPKEEPQAAAPQLTEPQEESIQQQEAPTAAPQDAASAEPNK